jgi:hypothetical protein
MATQGPNKVLLEAVLRALTSLAVGAPGAAAAAACVAEWLAQQTLEPLLALVGHSSWRVQVRWLVWVFVFWGLWVGCSCCTHTFQVNLHQLQHIWRRRHDAAQCCVTAGISQHMASNGTVLLAGEAHMISALSWRDIPGRAQLPQAGS